MKYTSHFIITLIIYFTLSSCNECDGLECPPTAPDTPIRILNKHNGNDLVFGNTALYDKRKFSCFSLKGNDTIHYNIFWATLNRTNNDSLLFFDFFLRTDSAIYFRLNANDIDTFRVTYKSNDTRCCGFFSTIERLNYNGVNLIPSNGVYNLKK